MGAKSQLVGLIAASAFALACGSAAAIPASPAEVDRANHSATLSFERGRQAITFTMREPTGVILLYRISAPRGTEIRASAELPGVTVPLRIATARVGPSSSCTERRERIICTVGEEGCPMPEATWRFRVEKLGGPAGDVTLWFRIGSPPGQS